MKKIVQINTTANWGSTGRIAEGIGALAMEAGMESLIAYGRGKPTSRSQLLRIGNDTDMRIHGIATRLFDSHGLASKAATRRLIARLDRFGPDIVHLHNIHGYYLNYPLLFEWIKRRNIPVIWTLHDCWSFTGHCAYFDFAGCDRWKTGCRSCPQLRTYPGSLLADGSERNYKRKRDAFPGVSDMTLVPVSDWLGELLSDSILKDYPKRTIHNGIDLQTFKPDESRSPSGDRYHILGVASVWDQRKGLDEFMKLRARLPENYDITLVGLSSAQITKLPAGIKGISRTDNIRQLVALYNMADLLVNPTLEDTFPTVNLESLACGTPVVTYRTGGSPESVDSKTGRVVEKGDIRGLVDTVIELTEKCPLSREECRRRAELLYDRDSAFGNYIDLYNEILFRR